MKVWQIKKPSQVIESSAMAFFCERDYSVRESWSRFIFIS